MSNTNAMRLTSLGALVAVVLAVIAAVAFAGSAAAFQSVLHIDPVNQNATVGGSASFKVKLNADVDTLGAQTNVTFDATKLQITSVTRGASYTGASFLMGVAPQTQAQAITEANTTGTLKNVSLFFLPGLGSVVPGDTDFVTVNVNVIDCGAVALGLANAEVLDGSGNLVPATLQGGAIDIACPTPTPVPTDTPAPTAVPTATPAPTPAPTLAPSQGQANVAGVVPPGFIQVTVPSHVQIPLEREALNTADVGVGIDSNTLWQLNVRDPKVPNRGFMTDLLKVLHNSMRVQFGATQVDLQAGGMLASGAGDSLVNAQLRQLVVPQDAPGNYSIDVLFEAVAGF